MSAALDREHPPRHALAVLASPVRRDILDLLANLPRVPTATEPMTRARGLTAAELGERLDLHVTTARFHLDQLIDVGLVSGHDERGHVGRPKRRYAASPGPLPAVAGTESYSKLSSVLAEALSDGTPATAEQAGRHWLEANAAALFDTGQAPPARNRSQWFSKIGLLLDVLDDWGYAPELTTTNAGHTAELQLHHCPLRDLVDTNPDVACGVHRGIIQGTLEALGEGDAELKLTPLTSPDVCLARITTRHNLAHRPPATKGPSS